MGSPTVRLRRADEEGLSTVETVLSRNDLPTGDVRSGPGRFYLGRDADGDAGSADPVSVGGLEAYGAAGVLRSLVVVESARGEGYGAATCEALEREARDAGVERLYLLTTTAADFFADRGYAAVDRADAPPDVRESAQFADLCPSTATCMSKSL